MYLVSKIEDTVRIPPSRFEEPLEDVAVEILNESYVGKIDKKLGLMVTVKEIEEIGIGKVIMGDGAAYHEVLQDFLKGFQHFCESTLEVRSHQGSL